MKKKIISLLLVIGVLLSTVGITYALEIKENHANFLAEEDLVVEKEINGTLFAAGNTVKVTSSVDGISFVAGNKVNVSGQSDYLFIGGNDITVDKVNVKDAFIAGSFISISDSTIRDLWVAGSKVTISSDITRDAYIAGEKVVINAKIIGDVEIAADKIELGERAEIVGKLKYPEEAKLTKAETTKINETETYKSNNVKVNISPAKAALAFIIGEVYSYLVILLIAFVMLFLFKKTFSDIKKMKKDASVLLTTLAGLIGLIVIPIASILIMITLIGIPLGVLGLVMYVIMIFLSIIPSVYFVGNWLFGKTIKNSYLLMMVSLLLFYVVKLIPFVGGLFELLMLLFGLGLYLMVIKNNICAKTK